MNMQEINLLSEREKETNTYKIIDLFIDDEQKESLIISLAYCFIIFLSKMPVIKDEVMDGGALVKTSSKTHTFIISFDKDNKLLVVLCKSKTRFLAKWERLDLPHDIQVMLGNIKDRNEAKKKLAKLLTMKAFW